MNIKNLVKNEKGSLIVELALSLLFILVFVIILFEGYFLIKGTVDIHKIAREGARELAISEGDINASRIKADLSRTMYFGSRSNSVEIVGGINGPKIEGKNASYNVTYNYTPVIFGKPFQGMGFKGVSLSARAEFPL